MHEKWHQQLSNIPLNYHDRAFEDGTRKIVGMIHVGTSKTDIKMNENLNTTKLTPVLNRRPLKVTLINSIKFKKINFDDDVLTIKF